MKISALIFIAVSQLSSIALASNNAGGLADFSPSSQSVLPKTSLSHGSYCVGKPGADVRINGRDFYKLQPGQSDTLVVDLKVAIAGKISVQINADEEGLALEGPLERIFDVNKNKTATFGLPVRALLEGRWQINLIVSTESPEGEVSSRALAVVVQVGNTVDAGGGQKKPTHKNDKGEPIIVMPADEKISN